MAFQAWPAANWPAGVPTDVSGYHRTVFSLLDETADKWPDLTFTIFNDAKRSYRQVKDTADRIANFLAGQGIGKGDRVAVFLPNLPHYPAIYFGILKTGAVCVTCNPMYTAHELNYQLKDAGAKAVFCMDHPQFYPTTVQAIKGTDVGTVVVCGVKSYLPPLKAFLGGLLGKIPKADRIDPAHFKFDHVVAKARPEPPKVDINPDEDLAVILYTGGTTGVPKGAALTHANFVYDLVSLFEWVRVPQEKGAPPEILRDNGYHTYLGVLPWYHSFGMTVCMLSAVSLGASIVCIPDPRAGNPPFTDVLKAVQKYKTTIVVAVPTIYVAFINHPLVGDFDLSSIVLCASGGAPLPVEVAKQFEAKTGAILFEGYGLSETAPILTVNPTNTEQRRFGSVGYPLPGTHVKIVDADTGLKEMPLGEDGEIAASGPQIMKGYWNKPEEDKAVFREIGGHRYFLTGDIGHIDEQGYILITDRKKDMVLVGGFNVYPREVEEILFTHPKVAQAAVIGVPDPRSGEAVKAFIQLKPGETATEPEFLDWCKENMAGYKRPRQIEFRETLPTSVVGKVLRRVLRDEEMDKLPT